MKRVKRRRAREGETSPPFPTVPELTRAPELASVVLLEHALDVVSQALVAEHRTLGDDLHRPADHGAVVMLADRICHRAAALRETLRRYRLAVRDAQGATSLDRDAADDDLF